MIKIRENGKVREFQTAEDLQNYLDAKNPKPKKKRKKMSDKHRTTEYRAVEEENTEENGEA